MTTEHKNGYFYTWNFTLDSHSKSNQHAVTIFAYNEDSARSRIIALWTRAKTHLQQQNDPTNEKSGNKNNNMFVHFLRGPFCEPLPKVLEFDIEKLISEKPTRYKHSNSLIITSSHNM